METLEVSRTDTAVFGSTAAVVMVGGLDLVPLILFVVIEDRL